MTDYSAKKPYSVVIRTAKGCNQYNIGAQSPSQAAILVMKQLGAQGVVIDSVDMNAGVCLLAPNECYARVDLLDGSRKSINFYRIKSKVVF